MKNNGGYSSKTKGYRLRALIFLPVLAVLVVFFMVSLYSFESSADPASKGSEGQDTVGQKAKESVFLLAKGSRKSAGKELLTEKSRDELEQINRFEPGAFENPDSCVRCHRNIYGQWSKSKHQYAWVDEFY